ncbi:hypothetical protein BDV93DRAFT_516972 [Ceratobasidium sp. AG-I]|nr:hypothetical protein BDV93DRAFT_516972 [Ceratobasidium sp. AG-I]
MSGTDQAGNVHVPDASQPSLAQHLNPASLLPLSFFDHSSPDSSQWSISVLQQWIEVQKPHIDISSNTAFGGPYGTRVLVFALSRLLQNISRIDSGARIPDAIRRHTRGHSARWSSSSALIKVRLCITTVLRDVIRSTSILSLSFNERSAAWETAIDERYHLWCERGKPLGPTGEVDDISRTCGVPSIAKDIERMWIQIQERRKNAQEADETAEASRIITQRGLRTEDSIRSHASPERVFDTEDSSGSGGISDKDTAERTVALAPPLTRRMVAEVVLPIAKPRPRPRPRPLKQVTPEASMSAEVFDLPGDDELSGSSNEGQIKEDPRSTDHENASVSYAEEKETTTIDEEANADDPETCMKDELHFVQGYAWHRDA